MKKIFIIFIILIAIFFNSCWDSVKVFIDIKLFDAIEYDGKMFYIEIYEKDYAGESTKLVANGSFTIDESINNGGGSLVIYKKNDGSAFYSYKDEFDFIFYIDVDGDNIRNKGDFQWIVPFGIIVNSLTDNGEYAYCIPIYFSNLTVIK